VERSGPAVCNVSLNREGKDEVIKASNDLQDLRRRLYVKAKSERSWRFWGLYVHVCKMETLRKAYALAEDNDGAPGVDGVMLKANGRCGVPQGGVISPLLSNLYLTEVDRMLERAKEVTRYGKYTGIEYARFADDLVILVDAHPRHDWLMTAVEKRLREELAALQVEVNEKSRIVDLGRGESFGFLGFDFRRIRNGRGVWRAHFTPKLKKRTVLLRKLKDVFRRHQSQPVERVISLINPILRGWVNYFAVGHASECFGYIQDWVEKKVRRHLMRARKRKGFGWARWSRQRLYETLKLFNSYKVRWLQPKVAPAG
jgi:RNA-directed DNA polymerase